MQANHHGEPREKLVGISEESLIDFHLMGAGCSTQCFPFFVYDEDGTILLAAES